MAYNEQLADRIREALVDRKDVEEKKMFRGVTFMVDGKMCISVSGQDMMCRIDPALHDTLLQNTGTRAVIMKGREYKGYILVSEEGIKTQKDFQYWIDEALRFNAKAKASKKKKR